MLRSVLLEGFRSFDQPTAVRFAPLTILAGPNNAGKSSVIQALLALVQSEQASSGDALLLSGAWCDLGQFDGVVSASRPLDQRRFAIGVSGETPNGDARDALWELGPPNDDALATARIHKLDYASGNATGQLVLEGERFVWTKEDVAIGQGPPAHPGEPIENAVFVHPGLVNVRQIHSPSGMYLARSIALSVVDASRTHYVGPFRAPPQPLYTPRTSTAGPPLGRYGEHTAELLVRHRTQRTDISVPRQPHEEEGTPILSAVNAWWSYLFDGSFALQVDAPARLGFTLSIDTPSAERLGLGQVGLGLSQTLPIVTACLVSRLGDHAKPGARTRIHIWTEVAEGRHVVYVGHCGEHLLLPGGKR